MHARVTNWAANRVLAEVVSKSDNMRTVRWLGEPIWQTPSDAWLLQEMVSETRPDLIVETGTYMGGSAFFFATLCDQLGAGEVVSVDIDPIKTIPHPRVTYLNGSSIDPGILATVRERAERAERVLVMLDSDHSAAHVYAELEVYSPLIRVGGYIHVQDGLIDDTDVYGETEPGPAVAARQFLASNPSFVRDVEFERRYVVTAHPYGWLKRVSPEPS
jgi:cephalosporin hydroxylase